MKVALVHDWLTGMRGGERVLEVFCDLFPRAPIHTLLHVEGTVSELIAAHPIHTSFLQRMPMARTRYRHYLPLYPRAIESLDLSGYDLVISSSHAVAKSVRTSRSACHVCYCFTPMRYLWDRTDDYFGPGRMGWPTRTVARAFLPRLRQWDVRTADRVDHWIAISRTIQDRIQRAYGAASTVIEPPVDTDTFTPGEEEPEDVFLVVSALVPYKRVDLIIEAFRGRPERLRIVGRGPERSRLEAIAPDNVTFLDGLTDLELRQEYRRCRALIHAAFEDFGIAPIEAMACGRPVVGFAEGALSETVIPGETGFLFDQQTPSSLRVSLDKVRKFPFNCAAIRHSAERYSTTRFRERFADFVEEKVGTRPTPETNT